MRISALNPSWSTSEGAAPTPRTGWLEFDCPHHPGHRVGINWSLGPPNAELAVWHADVPRASAAGWDLTVTPSIDGPWHGNNGKPFRCRGHFVIREGEVSG